MPWRESFDPSCRLGTAGWTSSCSKSRLFWPVCYGQPAYYRLYSWHVSWIQTGSYDKLITRYTLTDDYVVHAHLILLFLKTNIIEVFWIYLIICLGICICKKPFWLQALLTQSKKEHWFKNLVIRWLKWWEKLCEIF